MRALTKQAFGLLTAMWHRFRLLEPAALRILANRLKGTDDYLVDVLRDNTISPLDQYALRSLNQIVQDNKKNHRIRLDALKEIMEMSSRLDEKKGGGGRVEDVNRRAERDKKFREISARMGNVVEKVQGDFASRKEAEESERDMKLEEEKVE